MCRTASREAVSGSPWPKTMPGGREANYRPAYGAERAGQDIQCPPGCIGSLNGVFRSTLETFTQIGFSFKNLNFTFRAGGPTGPNQAPEAVSICPRTHKNLICILGHTRDRSNCKITRG